MLRDQFLLDPQITYLNHGSFGACPKPVFEVYQRWQRKLELEPVQFLGVELDSNLYQSRQALGNFVNAPTSDIVYIPNATHGVNIIARSLHLTPGDEILSTNHEYGACNFIWDVVCRKSGAVYKQQPIELPLNSADILIDQIWAGVTPRTKVIFVSHITSTTSITLPVQEICRRAREVGILSIIDGAHAPGQVNLDLNQIQADFYTGNCHKWMLSPKGAGFLYARPSAQELVDPLVVSWGYQSKLTQPRESIFVDLLQWTGTYDPAAALTVPAAINFMKENQWDAVQVSCHELVHQAIASICHLTNLVPLYPLDSDFYHQMGTIPIPQVKDLTGFKNRLFDEYKIEIPVIEWNQSHFLRISVQGYNSSQDIDKLLTALTELLPEMTV
jgi:isopenicillin-N epimerase